MSASIYYQPVRGTLLRMGGRSSFLSALTRAFGSAGPWTITDRDYHTLMGLAAGFEDTEQRAACHELAEAAMQHGEIRVWAEY